MSMPVTWPPAGHALGEDAAAAADVEHALAKQAAALVGDPVKAHRVDLMQRLEFALHVPPAGGDGLNLAISVRSTLASLFMF
jgi:hypothetical protein